MSLAERIEDLRGKIGQIENHRGREILSTTSLPAGVPRGALIELAGPAKLEWLFGFFREHEEFKIFWIEKEFTIFPTAIQQRGVSLERIVFAVASEENTQEEYFKTVRKALRSHAFEFVVVPNVFPENVQGERFLKTLQLLAEQANASVFLLTNRLSQSWPIAAQLMVEQGRVSVHKQKWVK